MMIETAIGILVALGALIFILSRRSVARADKMSMHGTGALPQDLPDFTRPNKGRKTFEGVYEGYPYVVEELNTGHTSVWMEPPGPVTLPFIASMESGALKVKCVHKDMLQYVNDDTDLQSLFGKGATYVDIGFNTDWLVAVFPFAVVSDHRESVEKICAILLKLDKKCSRE